MPISAIDALVQRFKFLDGALKSFASSMTSDDVRRLQEERAEVFKQLLAVPSSKHDLNVARLRVLLSTLQHAGDNPELVSFIAETSLQHVEALSIPPVTPALTLTPSEPLRLESCLNDETLNRYNALNDRVVIIDRDCRYLFANQPNADLHKLPIQTFVGRPLWSLLTKSFVERVNKPMFDKCFEGRPSGAVSYQPGRPRHELYSAHIDPLFDRKHQVVAAIAIVRRMDVSA